MPWVLLALVAAAFAKWPSKPERILFFAQFQERKGSTGSENWKRTCDELVACGPEAIQPVIKALRRNMPWYRGTAQLPSVFKGLGEPAHRALLEAIDAETEEYARISLIFSLQWAFEDFSRFDRLLFPAATQLETRKIMNTQGRARFYLTFLDRPDVPRLEHDGEGINPEFLSWWSTNKPPQK